MEDGDKWVEVIVIIEDSDQYWIHNVVVSLPGIKFLISHCSHTYVYPRSIEVIHWSFYINIITPTTLMFIRKKYMVIFWSAYLFKAVKNSRLVVIVSIFKFR